MEQFRFELVSDTLGSQFITTPVGWDSNKPTLTRNSKYSGMFRSFTVDLEFIGTGYDYLTSLMNSDGILAECNINIYEYNNYTHDYELQDTGKLDFTKYSLSDKSGRGVTVAITDSRFIETLKSREDVEVNYNNSLGLDGQTMSETRYVDQTIYGMDILSTSLINIPAQLADLTDKQNASDYMPTQNIEGQIEGIQDITAEFVDSNVYFTTEVFERTSFYIGQAPGTLILNGTITFDAVVSNSVFNGISLVIEQVRDPESYTHVKALSKFTGNSNGTYINLQLIMQDETFIVEKGDFFRIVVLSVGGSVTTKNDRVYIHESSVEMVLHDKASPTESKGVFIYDVFDRMVESITGRQNSILSPVFDSGGEYHDYTLQNGLLIRNYTEDESQLSFKFSELFQNLESIFNIGIGMSIDGNYLVIDDKRKFFENYVILTITKNEIEADSFTKEIDPDLFYSDIEVGYDKSAYEEVSGLEEYNNKSFFSTIINNINNKLDIISKIRGDGYGFEFARRLQKTSDETKDSKYDKDNFILNVYNDGGDYIQRTDEAFTSVTGIDQIETPINLEITPGRNIRRWGWMIAAGIQKYTDSIIKFNKSDVISDLQTELNGVTINENSDIEYEQLDTPLFTGYKIQFSAPLTLQNYQLLKSNPYKIIKVWNPVDNEYTYGWMREVSVEAVDKATNWELIEAITAEELFSYILWNDGGKLLWNDGSAILWNN